MLGSFSTDRPRVALGKASALVALGVTLVLASNVGQAQTSRPDPLFTGSASPPAVTEVDGPEVVRKRYVTFDVHGAIRSRTLELNLFPDKSLTVARDWTEVMGENGLVWIGKIVGAKGRVVLASVDDVLV